MRMAFVDVLIPSRENNVSAGINAKFVCFLFDPHPDGVHVQFADRRASATICYVRILCSYRGNVENPKNTLWLLYTYFMN